MALFRNNSINQPAWDWRIVGDGSAISMEPFNAYIKTGGSPNAYTIDPADFGITLGSQYFIACYGDAPTGFLLNRTGSQKFWCDGEEYILIVPAVGFEKATAIMATCIDNTPGAENFLIEVVTGEITPPV